MDLPTGNNNIVAIDTETSGLHPDDGATLSIISMTWENGSVAYPYDQGFLDKPLPPKYQPSLFGDDAPNLPKDHFDKLGEWLSEQWLVGHNIKFDIMMLNVGTRQWPGWDLTDRVIHDTALAASLLWPTQRIGLKRIAERLWGEEETKPEKQMHQWMDKREKRYDLAPWEIINEYAEQDAKLTWKLFKLTSALISEGEIPMGVWNTKMAFLRTLCKMEMRGVKFDISEAWRSSDLMEKTQKEAEILVPFQPVNQTQAKKWFYDFLGLAPSKTTPGGKPSIDKEVVADLVKSRQPGAEEYEKYNRIKYARSMWYDAWANMCGRDGRLRPVYHQTKKDDNRGTTTGRLAVERVQLQAVPHDYRLEWLPKGASTVRDLFIPEEGYELWEVDMSQAEMRVAAGVSHAKGLIAAFERGEDAHDATCRIVFGIDANHPRWDQYRTISKRLNFGMLYGAGISRIQEEIKIQTGIEASLDEVVVWVNNYKKAIPEIVRKSSQIKSIAEKHLRITLCTGKNRHFKPDDHLNKAFNALIQGNVAEMMEKSMVKIDKHLPGVMLIQVHDSIIIEIPEEGSLDVVKSVQSIMETTFEQEFGLPFKADRKKWGKQCKN